MSDTGLPAEVTAAIDQIQYLQPNDFPIEKGYATTLCAAVGNGNPLYWDAAIARDLTAGDTVPLTMLSVWFRPHYWAPGRTGNVRPLQVHFDLKEKLGFPTAIVAGNEIVFHEPVRPGDRLTACQILRSVSELKQTKLGRGRFWVVEVQYRNQRDELVGTDTYSCLGYHREPA